MELDEAAALFKEGARRSERCTERLLLLCRAFNEARRAIAQRRRRRSSERCCKAFLVHLAQKCIRLLRELREFLQQGFKGFDQDHPIAAKLTEALQQNFPEYLEGDSIKWNFTKFLVDRAGNVVARFEPTFDPANMAGEIEKLL